MEDFLVVAVQSMDHVPLYLTDSLESAREYAERLGRSDGELLGAVCARVGLTQSSWVDHEVAIYTFRDGMLDSVERVFPSAE